MTFVSLLVLATPAAAQSKPVAPCYNPIAKVCESPYVFRDFGQIGLTLARADAIVEAERARERSPEWITLLWERAWREGGGAGGGATSAE
jgi:hypothetical protein